MTDDQIPRADVLLRGGPIRTMGETAPEARALAAVDGTIVAVDDEAEALRDEHTHVIELDRRAAIPGINDAHLHAAWLGARWPRLFFGEGADSQHDGPLARTEDDRRRALLQAWSLLAELGITSYTEPGIGPGEDDGETGCFGSDMLETYLQLHREREQKSRVTLLRLFGTLDGTSDLEDVLAGIHSPVPETDERWLQIPGVKIFGDGIPPMRTAWLRTPYVDGSSGAPLPQGPSGPAEALCAMIRAAHARGLQVAVHATGDRTIDALTTAIERAGGAPENRPHCAVHADLALGDLPARMRDAGIAAAIQPVIARETRTWAATTLGAGRAKDAWPLARLLEAGTVTTITSDAPITTPDWRIALDAGAEMIGDEIPDARSRLLDCVTRAPAIQDGAADWKGSLEVGKVLDVCVLDDDPVASRKAFTDLTVEMTITDGRVVFDRATRRSVPASRT